MPESKYLEKGETIIMSSHSSVKVCTKLGSCSFLGLIKPKNLTPKPPLTHAHTKLRSWSMGLSSKSQNWDIFILWSLNYRGTKRSRLHLVSCHEKASFKNKLKTSLKNMGEDIGHYSENFQMVLNPPSLSIFVPNGDTTLP